VHQRRDPLRRDDPPDPGHGDERGDDRELGSQLGGHHLVPHPAQRHQRLRNVLFAALTLAALAYFIKQVPETKGLSLQQIERQLT
jgi:hypothetical protein